MNVLELVRRHGIEPKREATTHGGEYSSACPGCGGTDRFRIWPEENPEKACAGSYWCRQCGKGGDAIQFLRDFDGLTFREACGRLGHEIPDRPMQPGPARPGWKPEERATPEEQWSEKAGKFCHWALEQLFETAEAVGYLASRGLQEKTMAAFGLGWNPGREGKDLFRGRASWGLSEVKNEKGKARPLWLPVGLVIPCVWDGRIVRLRIRRPDPVAFGPRYYVVPGSSSASMLLERKRGAMVHPLHVVVESELDALLLFQEAGDLVDVVALGSVAAKPDERTTRALRKSAHILVAIDLDDAAAKYWRWWEAHFPEATLWPPRKGKDPGEDWQKGVNLREWVAAGLPEGLRG